jgi:DNA ligase-1
MPQAIDMRANALNSAERARRIARPASTAVPATTLIKAHTITRIRCAFSASSNVSAHMPDSLAANTFLNWAETADAVRATTKRLEKSALVERYLGALDGPSLTIAARFFSGIVFPRHDMRTTQVGGSIVWHALSTVTGHQSDHLGTRYLAHGDLGDLAGELLADRTPSGMTLVEAQDRFAELAAASGANARRTLIVDWLSHLGGLEARFIVKLLGRELRIGLKEAQVEEALAKTFGRPLTAIRRANLLRGDIGDVAQMARDGTLEQAALKLFHPIGFMLAQPLPTAEEIIATVPIPSAVEHKYDGIRAQAHLANGKVVLFSRTLDDISRGYPEIVAALAPLAATTATGLVLDGELVARSFLALQQRLGRKAPSDALIRDVPVAFVVFDLIAEHGALTINEPYDERRRRLEAIAWPGTLVRLTPVERASTAADIEAAFAHARASGNEGLVIKDPASPYTPGRRGKTWIKLKRAEDTLDVVVTAVERGHGRRRDVLSDYTFAVRASENDPTLLDVGKAYNGLTDAEIAALTQTFEALTITRHGGYHVVRPEIVLEVTFDIVQPSERHAAGYALRFPRIVRVRDDKPVSEIDTLERVRALAERHGAGLAATSDHEQTDLDLSDSRVRPGLRRRRQTEQRRKHDEHGDSIRGDDDSAGELDG